ncbi:hypothetical protein B296_00004011 [Ensete ventricosum]|uniref:Uncharacterized protein n=1 Tax=Ensete ventricosum TaxID=4639 RepID=A0A426ZZN1_ENSVE|nr:hypothetical protein B296_00004011 [Ensete ventricosum]
MEKEMEDFLRECERSGDAAYAAIKSLLERLEKPDTRSGARVFLARLQRRFQSKEDADRCFDTYHFRIHDVLLHDFQGPISFLLCFSFDQAIVYGLDINPRAVKVSWINLFLNALDENGTPVYDGEGKTLLDRVEFHESDLLAYCRKNNIQLERIVGCIPQVLNKVFGL